MNQVDFYILNNDSATNIELFVCRLAEKAFKKGHKIHILTANRQQQDKVDQLMWTFNDQSFLPHVISGDELSADTPIHISHDLENVVIRDVLINLKPEVPASYEQFDRIAEIVASNSEQRQAARLRYREYQRKGCAVASHEVNR